MAVPRHRPFLAIGINSTGYYASSWRIGAGDRVRYQRFEYSREVAEIAQARTLDAVFVSDHPALQEDGRSRPLHSLDPITLFAALAALDLISGGRARWNTVASFNPRVAANFGAERIADHDVCYRRSHDFVDVVVMLRLWWSFTPAGVGIDKNGLQACGVVRRSTTSTTIGEFFHVRGALNAPPSPQGRPVIAQASGSPQGLRFAALYGEVIYGSARGLGPSNSKEGTNA